MSRIDTAAAALFRTPAIRELLASFDSTSRELAALAAKADPYKHRLSTVMEDTSYRYWPAGIDGLGRAIRFCWTTHRNVAGYFLGWREIVGKEVAKRDRFVARKSRSAVAEIARRRQNAFIDKRSRKL